ncbi:ribosomal L4 [Lecanosticta acicola]|uniref:Large ribosomal subunit protein uL4m n=1 Tax=Lecanosticta acicola TaxID=111012 RepID=A0AAI8YXD5_9PEZI|nr:ribosomal L4 [Lecanosticta acicola]
MAAKRATVPAKHLFNGFVRSMSTEAAQQPPSGPSTSSPAPGKTSTAKPNPRAAHYSRPENPFITKAQCTLYTFPSMTPSGLTAYPSTHLLLPTRRDILHRAVIFEGDATRQGTASTKTRWEVHGSGHKVRPQKGTGRARLGDKKSPMLKGGGVAFGPKPRDFSTDLPKKIYDLAWRTALSYRYKMGELMIFDGEMEVEGVAEESLERYVRDLLAWNNLGRLGGKTLFVTQERREALFKALGGLTGHARALDVEDVDVKDLLEGKRVAIERKALEHIFMKRESDLVWHQRVYSLGPQRAKGLLK